jgi:hypothetical protein
MLSLNDLKHRIITVFERIPIEDGYNHPGQRLIQKAISKMGDEALLLLFFMLFDPGTNPSLAAGIIRCLGRLPIPDEEWCVLITSEGLKSTHIEVRDAIMQAVESWDNKRIFDELKKHNEPNSWLKDYSKRILN